MFSNGELRATLYFTLSNVGGILLLIYNIFMLSKKRQMLNGATLAYRANILRKVKPNGFTAIFLSPTLLAIIELVILSVAQILTTFLGISRAFGDMVGTGANYFAVLFFGPLFVSLVNLLTWSNPLKTMDLVTPAFVFSLICDKIGCFSSGCCHGIEWLYGTFNYRYGRPEVPIQLVECLWGVLILIFLLRYKKKAKTGTVFPLYVILFSATRFCSEFFRGEENVLGPLKIYHILCIVGVIYGIILYVLATHFEGKITNLFDNTTYFTKGKLHNKVVAMREEFSKISFSKKTKEKVSITE